MVIPVTSDKRAAHVEVTDTQSTGLIDLSVIVVNYNVREFLEQALRSVERASKSLSVEVFVVDNNSVDGSIEMVQSAFPEVRLIVNEENIGFGSANNQAICQARGRFLLILNPDTIVQEDTLETLVRFMESHPTAGAVGCKILNPDGTFAPESRRAFPTPSVALFRLIGLSRLFPNHRLFGRYNMTYLPQNEVAEVDALSGSCMMVRHAALHLSLKETMDVTDERGSVSAAEFGGVELSKYKIAGEETTRIESDTKRPLFASKNVTIRNPQSAIRNYTGAGLFDEDFFMYGEDLDWCYRIQQAGWKIYYTPDTQIIHYKGESTKKGEIRYVRLFYGAMLRFIEKHFQSRYSRLFAHMLRVGIFARAMMSVLANGLRHFIGPLIDFTVVFTVVSVLGTLHSIRMGATPSWLYFATVAPAYALGTTLGILFARGYKHRMLRRLRPVWFGTGLGFLLVATASFFIKDIAFSRFVVLLSFPVAALSLIARRLIRKARVGKRSFTRRAILVGHTTEARRLHQMLARHPNPPFVLMGYVESDRHIDPTARITDPPRLGTLRQLRELVRIRGIDEVVFAADGLSHQTIFHLIQQLRGLPVQFKMLAEGREHVIGKDAIDDLSMPALVDVQKTILEPRSTAARRIFEVPIALMGLILHPVVKLLAWRSRHPRFYQLLGERTKQMPAVLRGHTALIGYSPGETPTPPPEWNLKPGVFAITDTFQDPRSHPEEKHRTYWFYFRNQSASLDWDLLVRSIDILRNSST